MKYIIEKTDANILKRRWCDKVCYAIHSMTLSDIQALHNTPKNKYVITITMSTEESWLKKNKKI